MSVPSLLLLIPAYNEEARIEPVLREFADFFGRNYAGPFQLVVVLNGCRDNTLGVVQRVAKEFPCVSWLDFPAAIGKGGALIEGLKLAGHADLIRDTQCGAKVMKRAVAEKSHPTLRIADMAFDINLLVSIRRAGFKILEVPTEWTDQAGSKVTIGRTSLTMFLSVVRVRLIYSPFYKLLRPLRPLEAWVYKKLRAPQPLPSVSGDK